MNLPDYLTKAKISQAEFAKQLGVTQGAVAQWIGKPAPIERCVAIERATGGKVTRKDLRPADWQHIWPELLSGKQRRAA